MEQHHRIEHNKSELSLKMTCKLSNINILNRWFWLIKLLKINECSCSVNWYIGRHDSGPMMVYCGSLQWSNQIELEPRLTLSRRRFECLALRRTLRKKNDLWTVSDEEIRQPYLEYLIKTFEMTIWYLRNRLCANSYMVWVISYQCKLGVPVFSHLVVEHIT